MASNTIVTPDMDGENGQLAGLAIATRTMVQLNVEATGIDPGMIMSAILSGLCSVAADHGQRTREGWAEILEAWARDLRRGEPLAHQLRDAIGRTEGNA